MKILVLTGAGIFPSSVLLGCSLLVAAAVGAADESAASDLVTPEMTIEQPAAGRRVRQVAVEYQGTQVYHALYLPVDWQPGRRYPVIVEYAGNEFAPSGSTGEVKDANLGYGLTGGTGFLWVCMPCIAVGGQQNATLWWRDQARQWLDTHK
jgi:hypothetical protein